MIIDRKIVTHVTLNPTMEKCFMPEVDAFVKRLCLGIPMSLREANCMDRDPCLILSVNTENGQVSLQNISRKDCRSDVIMGSFPRGHQYKPGDFFHSVTFGNVMVFLQARRLTRLEEIAFEYLDLLEMGSAGAIPADSQPVK